jgi:hypothetical protein
MPIIWKYIWKFSGGMPLIYRILTAMLHCLATLFVLMIGFRLTKDKAAALITGVLFSVHPIHSETLGSIVSQADILSTIFGLIAMLLVIKDDISIPKMILANVLLLFSCLTKESGVVFAVIVFVLPLFKKHYVKKEIGWLSVPALSITLTLVLFQILLERGGENSINSLTYSATGFERTLHGLYIIGRSISMCFVPLKLSFSHDYAAIDLSLNTLLPYAIIAFVALSLCAAFIFRAFETKNIGWVIIVALLTGPAIIQSGLLVAVNTEIAERLLYMSSISSCMIIAGLIVALIKHKNLIMAFTGILAGLFLIQSYYVEKAWLNNRRLFEFATRSEPLSWRVHNNHATTLVSEGKIDEAIWHFMLAAYILSNRPSPVDVSPIEKLENMDLANRLAWGPAFFNPENPSKFIKFFYEQLILLFRFPYAIEVLNPIYEKRYGAN